MCYARWLAIYLSIAAILGEKDIERNGPVPVLDPGTAFLPRAITFFSYMFPLRDDTTSFTFGKDEKHMVRETLFNLTKLASLLPKGKKGAEGHDAASYDRPFWRDFPTHSHSNRLLDVERIATFHMANPALRRTEYNKERCGNGGFQSYKGMRIIQTYVERGVPFEVPCYSCFKNQSGHTTVFFLIPSRNFLADIDLHERREAFDDTDDIAVPLSSWLLHQIKHNQSSDVSKYEEQFVFGLGRAAGGHTSMDFQHILGDNTGRLQVNVVNASLAIILARAAQKQNRMLAYEKFFGGLTLICAQLVDNEPRSLGFIHNIDYLVNPLSADDGDRLFEEAMYYEHFEPLNSTSTLPFTSTAINIKIDISWEEWSCCSACCCSVTLCGLYSNQKKCHEVDSYRTRRGFLSVFLLNSEKQLVLPSKAVSAELDKILRLSPYRERGIAVFSSLVLRVPRFKEHFWHRTLKEIVDWGLENWIGTAFKNYKGLGMFIEQEDCSAMEQKMNCSALAACRGQLIQEPPSPIGELIPVDPCADLPMVTLSVSESSASFRFEPNTSYRLRLDGVDMETAKSIIWKVGGDAVHAYEPTKRCQEQGVAVHANGADLILIEVNATQVVGHVIEAFTGRHRFRIHFLVDRKEGESISDHRIAIQIAGIIGGGGSLLLAAITIIHNYKCRERPKITEKSRGKNEGPSRKTIRALRKHFKGRALTPTTHAKQEAQAIPI